MRNSQLNSAQNQRFLECLLRECLPFDTKTFFDSCLAVVELAQLGNTFGSVWSIPLVWVDDPPMIWRFTWNWIGSTVMGTSTWPVSLKAIKTRLQPWNLTLPAGHFRKLRDVQRDCPSTIHRMNGLSRRNHVRESHASDPFEQRTWRQGRNTFKPVYDTSIIYYILIYTYIHIL